ncbi:MAG: hypothetical protein IJ871_06555 [Ruminococcus sp.]|jgi:hypothetical protein|nr:hypothetical protein [Ruminococcus sp.]MBR2304783.1 hypothetical protein [Ruminococcus sp.]
MTITLSGDYRASVDDKLLGYIGETSARTITLSGYLCEDANAYSLIADYGDGVSYELDMTDGTHLIEGSLLRREGSVLCQVLAKAYEGDSYRLVKKSNVFELYIAGSLSNETAPIPTYEEALSVLDEIRKKAGIHSEVTTLTGVIGGTANAATGILREVTV